MRVEDALRKIRLLRRLIPENGASEFEAETAGRLVQALMERYSIGKEDVHAVASPSNRMTWIYWELLMAEFGIALNRFGGRASASLGNSARVVIRLATGHWHVEQASPEGWKIAVRDSGLESLRGYLSKHGPRSYSLVG
jgi:uncharacterized protein DUF2786